MMTYRMFRKLMALKEEGYTFKQIREEYELPVGTIRRWFAALRRNLRAYYSV